MTTYTRYTIAIPKTNTTRWKKIKNLKTKNRDCKKNTYKGIGISESYYQKA